MRDSISTEDFKPIMIFVDESPVMYKSVYIMIFAKLKLRLKG